MALKEKLNNLPKTIRLFNSTRTTTKKLFPDFCTNTFHSECHFTSMSAKETTKSDGSAGQLIVSGLPQQER